MLHIFSTDMCLASQLVTLLARSVPADSSIKQEVGTAFFVLLSQRYSVVSASSDGQCGHMQERFVFLSFAFLLK